MFVFTLELNSSLVFAMVGGGDLAVDADGEVSYSRVSMEVPRRSLAFALSPLRLIDGLPRRSSFSYDKMPVEPIKLSVLKLDGSSFDIEVLETATVGELKMAVEAVFSHLPKQGPGKISWPHVWGQFCLCYKGHKLIAETDYLSDFGIKDGDQLHFIRHISNSYILLKSQKKARVSALKQPKPSLPEPKTRKKKERKLEEDNVETIARSRRSFPASILGGLVSYSMLSYKGGTENRAAPVSSSSRHRSRSFRGLKELVTIFRFRCYSEKDVWARRLISNS